MPHGITPEWLGAELRAIGLLPASAAVASVAPEPVGEGVGMMSELARLRVTYQGGAGSAPASFIAKFPSQNANNRGVAMSYRLYEREVRYFVELDPLTHAKTPRQYIARRDGDNFLLLMEDLGDYRAGDQRAGATLEETRLAIDELAKLHAAFWDKTGAIDWVPGVAGSYHADNMAALLVPGWPSMLKHFGAFVPDAIARQGDAFRAALPSLQARMAGPPATLLHGDFRMENFLFGARPEHHPLVIIDWQGPLLGSGMVDVALLLAQSTRTEVRRVHERDLLRRYVDGLFRHGVAAYPIEQALADYESALLYSWCYVAVVSGTLDASNPRAFAWMSQMVSRQAAATEDHDSFRLLR
jgi:aminoglycoside/choline kinase family phosphotransferase